MIDINHVVAVDIGATKAAIAIVSNKLEVIKKTEVPTGSNSDIWSRIEKATQLLIDSFNFAYNFPLIQTVLISNTYHISILNLEIDWSKTNNLDLTLFNIRKVLDRYSFYVSDNGRYKTFLLRNF